MKELTEVDPKHVPDKPMELEDRFRRNNFRTDGITEQSNETWEEYEEKVMEVIKDKSNIENFIDIVDAIAWVNAKIIVLAKSC